MARKKYTSRRICKYDRVEFEDWSGKTHVGHVTAILRGRSRRSLAIGEIGEVFAGFIYKISSETLHSVRREAIKRVVKKAPEVANKA